MASAAPLSLAALLKQHTTIACFLPYNNSMFPAVHLPMKGASFLISDGHFSFNVQSKSLVGGAKMSPREAPANSSVLNVKEENLRSLPLSILAAPSHEGEGPAKRASPFKVNIIPSFCLKPLLCLFP